MPTNAVRQSSRREAPSAKVRANNDGGEASFVAAGQRKAREIEEFGGEDSRESSSGGQGEIAPPAGDLEGEVEVLGATAGNAPVRKHQRKGKWTLAAMTRVAEKGLKFQCWQVKGRKETVPQQWQKAEKEIRDGPPWSIMFESIALSAIVSKFNTMVSEKSAEETTAAATTGGGEDGSEEHDDETVKLKRVLGTIVDAKALLRAEKRMEQQKTAIHKAAGLAEKQNAERRCNPGAGSTSFGVAHASDERARAKVLRDLPTAGSRGASQGGGSARKVPPLGDVLKRELSMPCMVDLVYITGTTSEQVDLVMDAGFSEGDIPFETAVSILQQVLASRMTARWGGFELDDFLSCEAEGSQIPGFGRFALSKVCEAYGVDHQLFLAWDRHSKYYTDGWLNGDHRRPTEDEIEGSSEKLATLLLYGTMTPNIGASPEHPSDSSSSSSSSSSREVLNLSDGGREQHRPAGRGGKRAAKTSRKTRNNTNRIDEDCLLQMINEMSQKQDHALQIQLQREELKDRRLLDEKAEAERVRKEEREIAEQLRKEERQHDRELRQEQWDQERKVRKDERDDERRERRAEQEFELEKPKLQLALASKQSRS